jgi:hypothetical protein
MRDKTFAKRFRSLRRRKSAEGSWTPIEPGKTPGQRRARAAQLLGCTLLVLFFASLAIGVCSNLLLWEQLRTRGQDAQALVTGFRTDEGDVTENYIEGYISQCCDVEVAITTFEDHQLGSYLPVRYDPHHPTNAEALVDRPANYELLLQVASLVMTLPVLIAIRASRRRRLSRILSEQSGPPPHVKFEAWRHKSGDNTVCYLVLFDVAATTWDEPLLCVPVRRTTIGRLKAGDALRMFGSGRPGDPIALRREGFVITPTGATMPGAWERTLRREVAGSRVLAA